MEQGALEALLFRLFYLAVWVLLFVLISLVLGSDFSPCVKSTDSNESAGRQHGKIKLYAQVQQHSLLAGV